MIERVRKSIADTITSLGPTGVAPLALLTALAAAERFDALAFGVLAPNIRDAFHLNNADFLTISTLTAVLPLLASVHIGNWADRANRIRICVAAGILWAATAVGTGLAPVVAVLIVARLLGGIGQTVNQPVHSSLLSDYHPPTALSMVFTLYLLGSTGFGLIGSPLSGLIAQWANWRVAFVVLGAPTVIFALMLAKMREPARGEAQHAVAHEEIRVSIGEGFRRVRAIRSLQRTWSAAFFFGAGVASFTSLVSLYFKDVFHMGPGERGIVTGVSGLVGLAGFIVAGRLSSSGMRDKGAHVLPVQNGVMVLQFAACLALMGLAPWRPVAIFFAIVLGFGASGFLVPYQTMVALVAPPRLRAQAFAWSLVFFTMGAVVFAPIVGALGDHYGQRVAVVVLAAAVGLGGAIEITARRFVDRDVAQAVKLEEAAASSALISCRGVDVAYDGVQVLFGVDLDIDDGEIIALLGTNGAGKSTLLKAISGLVDPSGGAIYCNGRDVTHADAGTTAELGIVQVPGGRGVFPTLTVADNLRAAAWMFRKDASYVRDATDRVLEYFPKLRERMETPAGSLSGGEQQMLSLAQAFIAKPKLLLIDELSLGLAPTVVNDLLKIVRDIHASGTTVLLVEQSVNTALELAKRVVFMEKGEVRFTGPAQELLERPDILRAVFLQGASAHLGNGQTKRARTNGSARADTVRRKEIAKRRVVLQTHEIAKHYGGVVAVDDVDITLHEGEILGLIGPNGAGKTTLFDLICGFTPSNGGRVTFHDTDISELSADERAREGLGRSFQDARLWPSLTVGEAISVGYERSVEVPGAIGAMFHIPSVLESEAEVAGRTEMLIELLGLQAFRDKFVAELSTGSRRIVEIAAILAHRPSVLLLDEPSSGIAQKETESLGPLLRQVQDKLGCALLVIEHDMPLITGLADNLVALEQGQVVTHGAPKEVLAHPQVIESFLGTRGDIHVTGNGRRRTKRVRSGQPSRRR